jgi:hypothetical protein
MSSRPASSRKRSSTPSEELQAEAQGSPAAAASSSTAAGGAQNPSKKQKSDPHATAAAASSGSEWLFSGDGEYDDSDVPMDDYDLEMDREFCYDFDFSPLEGACKTAAMKFECTPERALVEWKRLLELKIFARDTDGLKIKPTPLMEFMWRAAVLDTKMYEELQRHIFTHLHRPRVTSSGFIPWKPINLLRDLYSARYGEEPVSFNPLSTGDHCIFVKCLDGSILRLMVNVSDLVESIKQKVHEATDIEPERQNLIYAGKRLEDGRTVTDYDIQLESTLLLLLRSTGC